MSAGLALTASQHGRLKAPEAELFDEQGKSIGNNFDGPTWQLSIPGVGLLARAIFSCWEEVGEGSASLP